MAPSDLVVERLRTAFDLFATGERIMEETLRRRHPEAEPEEIQRRLDQWLAHRPGAENGDCPGRSPDRPEELEPLR